MYLLNLTPLKCGYVPDLMHDGLGTESVQEHACMYEYVMGYMFLQGYKKHVFCCHAL